VFLTALAVIDDLAAILVIGAAYTSNLSVGYLAGSLGMFALLVAMNRMGVMSLAPYLLGGAVMWFLMLKSGVHATVSGVLLAFAIPFRTDSRGISPSHRMEEWLHRPVAFVVLPLFALANTGVVVTQGWQSDLLGPNSVGILVGLLVGKPVGITLASFIAVAVGLCRLPGDLRWAHVAGAGLLGGIGFTMSIFITNLAFSNDPAMVNASKMAILLGSVLAGVAGVAWLFMATRPRGARAALP
jgi:NhaA family Na+:H+ antiporter